MNKIYLFIGIFLLSSCGAMLGKEASPLVIGEPDSTALGTPVAIPGDESITVQLETEAQLRCRLNYGPTKALGSTTGFEAAPMMEHALSIMSLAEDLPVYFQIECLDADSKLVSSLRYRSYPTPKIRTSIVSPVITNSWVSDTGQYDLYWSSVVQGPYQRVTGTPERSGENVHSMQFQMNAAPSAFFELRRTSAPAVVMIDQPEIEKLPLPTAVVFSNTLRISVQSFDELRCRISYADSKDLSLGSTTVFAAEDSLEHLFVVSNWALSTPMYYRVECVDDQNRQTISPLYRSYPLPRLTYSFAFPNQISSWVSDPGQYELFWSAAVSGPYSLLAGTPSIDGNNVHSMPFNVTTSPTAFFQLSRKADSSLVVIIEP